MPTTTNYSPHTNDPATRQKTKGRLPVLVSLGLYFLGWLIFLVGLGMLQRNVNFFADDISAEDPLYFNLNLQWFHFGYYTILFLLYTTALFRFANRTFRPALLTLTGISFVFVVQDIHQLLGINSTGAALASAGLILMAVIKFIWILLLGTENNRTNYNFLGKDKLRNLRADAEDPYYVPYRHETDGRNKKKGKTPLLISFVLFALGLIIFLVGLSILQRNVNTNVGFIPAQDTLYFNLNLQWFHFGFYSLLFFFFLAALFRFAKRTYRPALLTLTAISFVFVVRDVHQLLGIDQAGAGVASGGLILMAVIFFIWILILGTEDTYLNNSFVGKDKIRRTRGATEASTSSTLANNSPNRVIKNNNKQNLGADQTLGLADGRYPNNSTVPLMSSNLNSTFGSDAPTLPPPNSVMTPIPVSQQLPPVRAKALYSYIANAQDPRELSFTKGDLLLITNRQGKWWQAEKLSSDGSTAFQSDLGVKTTGIVPSNYLEILD